jgi:hypothetical protein
MFWLAYIPFYERLFPIFENKTDTAEDGNKFKYIFSFDKLERQSFGGDSRDFKPSGRTVELSFGRFAKLLRGFADFIEGIQR